MKFTLEFQDKKLEPPSRADDILHNHESADTARKEIEGLRNEINTRVRQRDSALFGYLTGAAAITSIAFNKEEENAVLLLIIPFLALSVSAIIAQHHTVIGRREAFIKSTLRPFLEKINASAPYHEQNKEKNFSKRELMTRTWAHAISLFVPVIFALAANFDDLSLENLEMSIIWVIAFICSVFVLYFIVSSHKIRTDLLKQKD